MPRRPGKSAHARSFLLSALILSAFLAALAGCGSESPTGPPVTHPHFVLAWGDSGSGPGQFFGLSGVAVDRNGNVFVAELFNDRIQKFTGDGVFLTSWGQSGSEPGEFK